MRSAIYKGAISIFLICYLSVGVASHHRKTTVGGVVYKKLRWMHTTLCFWQNWGMFAPPPGSTSWLLFEGKTADGETITIEPLHAETGPDYFHWRYSRLQKLSLSSFQKSRKALRRGIAQNACHRAELAGTPVKSVQLSRDRTWAQRPSKRWSKSVISKRHKLTEIEDYKCR
jgi:hypothetical protein